MQTIELIHLVRLFVEALGIDSIKLTGGEPLCSPDIIDIIREIKAIEGVQDLSLTTNGSLLRAKVNALKDAGLDRLNISIWSLDPATYRHITGHDGLTQVLASLIKVSELDFKQVKLNFTPLRHYNVAEFWAILDLAHQHNLILQLIELHKIEGINPDLVYEQELISIGEIEKNFLPFVKTDYTRKEMQNRRVYKLNTGAIIEAVVMGRDTCSHCSKIRLTYDGQIKPCLLRNDSNVDLIGPLRDGVNDNQLRKLIQEAAQLRRPFFT